MGIEVLPPDVNESDWLFTVVGDGHPLRPRRGQGGGRGRGRGGARGAPPRGPLPQPRPPRLPRWTCARSTTRSSSALIKAGAFDGLGVHRARALGRARRHPRLRAAAARGARARAGDASSAAAAGGAGGVALGALARPARPPAGRAERLRYEKEALGFYLTGNPLSEHEETLRAARHPHHGRSSREGVDGHGDARRHGDRASRRVKIKSGPNAGRFMGRFVLEDLDGSLPVTLFANQLQQFGHLLAEEARGAGQGQVRERGSAGGGGGEVELAVEEIRALAPAAVGPLLAIELVLDPETPQGKLLELKNLLLEHHGEVPVTLELDLERRERDDRPLRQLQGRLRPRPRRRRRSPPRPRPPPRAPHRAADGDAPRHPLRPRPARPRAGAVLAVPPLCGSAPLKPSNTPQRLARTGKETGKPSRASVYIGAPRGKRPRGTGSVGKQPRDAPAAVDGVGGRALPS